uniref:Uncharacterized protein n=1 Tax=Nelumbo nucifera TaxID=4432 RepID=A0A822Y4K5_NELNU|nr:TPA_asm: hypothetical protein HUJ06_028009 [Nelumbo nucifera]
MKICPGAFERCLSTTLQYSLRQPNKTGQDCNSHILEL